MRKCKYCAIDISHKRKSAKFCSHNCRMNFHYGKAQKPESRECKYCHIDISHRRGNARFCSKQCLQKFVDALPHRIANQSVRKKCYNKHKKSSCEFCGFVAIHSCQLDIDHIDGNHDNNDPENLQTLCANCHRLKTQLQKDYKHKNS